MGDIVKFTGGNVVGYPTMDRALKAQVDGLMRGPSRFSGINPHDPDDAPLYLPAPEPVYHSGAREALAEMRKLCEPAGKKVVAAWLASVADGLNQMPTDAIFATRVTAVFSACADLPAAVWCAETLTKALQTFKWLPGSAEVYALLKPYANNLTSARDALERIANAPRQQKAPPPPPSEPVTDEDRQKVSDLVARFVAERSYNQQPEDRSSKGEARPLSDGALLEQYRRMAREGTPMQRAMAETRISMLAERLKGDRRPSADHG